MHYLFGDDNGGGNLLSSVTEASVTFESFDDGMRNTRFDKVNKPSCVVNCGKRIT
ncbi:hypothetical protein HanPI659440_Chr09g0320281 [Helianthus annuus]|nr:hypothetical protein HanPI659440_Chr09g0320281 [Helianthus annuus]